MKLRTLLLLGAGMSFSPCVLAQEAARDPYLMLGCKLGENADLPEYKTSSITIGYSNSSTLVVNANLSCAKNLQNSSSYYDIISVSSVGDEIVYTLKLK